MPSKYFEILDSPQVSILSLEGKWRMPALKEISSMLSNQTPPKGSAVEVNAEKLEEIDTAGALLLLRFLKETNVLQKSSFIGLNEAHQSVIELVQKVLEKEKPGFTHAEEGLLVKIGKGVLDFLHECLLTLSFLGEVICECFPIFLHPKRIRWKEFFVQLEMVCINAIPIIILVSALIGFVLAYLFSDQLQKYGANIFIVEGVTIAMARELSPMIAAVVMAGRSGSSFTAQIGAMKLNEEIDAIKILGLSPMHVLVMPRIVALMVALPLLVLIGDVAGIFGGILISNIELGITPDTFIERIKNIVSFRHFIVGVIKAPVFALFIAIIGCRMGMTVENNARSVGLRTTATVVQSIVSVILLDAAFAVIFLKLRV